MRLLYLLCLIALLLAAWWLRIEALDRLPPGLSNDEAINATDVFAIASSGNFPIYEDHGRPEPLYRIALSAAARFTGADVWTLRVLTALISLTSIAAACTATGALLRDQPPVVRAVGGLFAAAALAFAINHLTLSRALYRAILQPTFTLLFVILLLRALASERRRRFVLAGAALAGAMTSYTAALVIPLALPVVALHQAIFRRRSWRIWGGGLAWLMLSAGTLLLPVASAFIDQPARVIGRAVEVNSGAGAAVSLAAFKAALIDQTFVRGDINPQYNVDQQPLVSAAAAPLLLLGLLALLRRFRQPGGALLLALAALATLPVVGGQEIPHGLRYAGAFAVFPLLVGAGAALLIAQALRFRPLRAQPGAVTAIALIAIAAFSAQQMLHARAIYHNYWTKSGAPYTWSMFGREMPIADWFFRPDRRDFARWLLAQEQPLLVPREELEQQTTRAWLQTRFPRVSSAGDDFSLPAGTRLVVPHRFDTQELWLEATHYALLHRGAITLLPPFSASTHAALLAGIAEGDLLPSQTAALPHLARSLPVPAGLPLAFEPQQGENGLLPVRFGGDILLTNWRGPTVLSAGMSATYTLEWQPLARLGHFYSTFLQLQTADHQRLAGDDVEPLRWLFPTSLWRTGEIVPDIHRFTVPPDIAPGAYRLAAGIYTEPERPLAAFAPDAAPLSIATIGWVKVPLPELPVEDAGLAVDALVADALALRAVEVRALDGSQVEIALTWQALVERPPFDATIFVHLLTPEGQLAGQQDGRPLDGQYPTFIWSAGERVRTTHRIAASSAALETLRLQVGMYTFPNLARLPVIQDGQSAASNVIDLGTLGRLR